MGKYVVISRDGGDFSMDLIFAGLVRKFGKDNVIDFPPRKKHRQGMPKLIGDSEHDYGIERRSLCFVEGCENMKEWSLEEIMLEDVDLIFLDETDESFEYWLRLSKFRPKNTVVVAGHDKFRGSLSIVRSRFNSCLAKLFCDDWQKLYDNYPFASLINLSCNFDHMWDVENRNEYVSNKKYDLCFIGYNSHPARKVVIDHVKNVWSHLNNFIIFEERPDKFDAFIRHDEMFRAMAQSRVCLNMRGASTNGRALRYYEIPYVGSWMLSQYFPAKLLHPMPCATFDTLQELDELIDDALANPSQTEEKAKNLHEHCMKYHTVDARIDYILELIKNG